MGAPVSSASVGGRPRAATMRYLSESSHRPRDRVGQWAPVGSSWPRTTPPGWATEWTLNHRALGSQASAASILSPGQLPRPPPSTGAVPTHHGPQDGHRCPRRNDLLEELESLPTVSISCRLRPVMFPPGRARLWTYPSPTGS